MFDSTNAFSGFSVDDILAARTFYGETLGLDVTENAMGFLDLHLASGATILIYSKKDHSPASFTILNFPVADMDNAVAELTSRGVEMTRYEGVPHDDNGVVRGHGHGPDIAWFTDPAGNVLSVLQADD